ncbi:MAG TPA: class I SAM-dependent methyltransferase [Terriglobales bacterium]
MTTLTAEKKPPTPERIFNTLNAYQETAVLQAAIGLDVFTAIAEGNNQPAALAKRVGAAERGVRVLCDFLTVQGFLHKNANRYDLTEESARFLDRRSPSSVASISEFLGSERLRQNFDALAAAVRKGGTADTQGDNTKPNDEFWVRFAQTMAPLSVPTAEFIATLLPADHSRPCKVLDIAAGHGMYGITIAKRNPHAEIVAVDWPEVLEVAKENARKHGIAERYRTRPGSAFETDLGSGYDYALLTNIFHHFDMATCEKLMRRIHAALKPEGKAITVDFVPNEDRVTPPTAARFALVMLASTDAGDTYTLSEYEKMFQNAGFASTTLHAVPGMPNQVLVSQK